LAKKDNSTFHRKATLRLSALKELTEPPVILETHGGAGKLFDACYYDFKAGVVFENDPVKVTALARQRSTWRVFESDSEKAIAAGVAGDMPINFVDCDPYGQPWPVLEAFFASDRERANRLVIVVNDGLRQKLQTGSGWSVDSMREACEQYGTQGLFENYLAICKGKLKQIAAQAEYSLSRWTGYYCGAHNAMTHYAALFNR
jgi:hypothetical protein